jgi:broad specificity phosphatase PhoE
MIQIKIIRHSERLDYSYPHYWIFYFGHYWADTPLSTNGHKMAQLKGIHLITDGFAPKYIYTSPYTRTMATATEIKNSFPQSELVIEPLLSEYQPTYKHAINLYPNGIQTTYDGIQTDFYYPETYDKFTDRVKFIIHKLIEKNDHDLIIITHGEVLKIYIAYLQSRFPDKFLESSRVPYLTTLSFKFDKINNKIEPDSISILI